MKLSKKTGTKNLMYLYFLGQDIHLSDFSKNTPNMPTYFFQVKRGGWGLRPSLYGSLVLDEKVVNLWKLCLIGPGDKNMAKKIFNLGK